ncbi:MAG: NHL repeat-containing protein [Verrucomicrobiales bacterium]|nr:NHL repeat-containing protein [Verrucomicrobiales bacterium]
MKRTLLILPLCLSTSLMARPGNHAPANSILGQTSLTTQVQTTPPTPSSLTLVEGVAIDPVTGKLFVADSGNHRILRFSSTAAYQTNAEAEAVFGQPDFTSSSANRGNPDLNAPLGADPSADSLDNPVNLCFDAAGRLWVTDSGNARVLRFDGASEKPSFTAAADAVIGQPDFTSDEPAPNNVADSGFATPAGIAIDASGRLWVSDSTIPRVLRFDNAASLSFNAVASGYLGEKDANPDNDPATFDSDVVSASSFGAAPYGLAVDAQGTLWLADASNNRVLGFTNAAAKADGADADIVLGQGDFLTRNDLDPPTAASMNSPYYVAIAPDGVLWVSDYSNYRVLGFVNPGLKTNGAPANLVLGQADFVSRIAGPPTPRSIDSPTQIAFGREGSLFLGQYLNEGSVKRWSDPVVITAPKSVTAKGSRATIKGTASGASAIAYQVAGQGGFKPAAGSVANWKVKAKKLVKRSTRVTIQGTSFDGRTGSAKVKVVKGK